jgi:hypothetical protein
VDGASGFGRGLLAFENGSLPFPIRTTLDDPLVTGPGDPFVVTTYFEREFTFNGNLADVDQLLLGHVIDDGAVFYLNGVEVLRFNMAGGTVTAGTFSNGSVAARTLGRSRFPAACKWAEPVRRSASTSPGTDITFGAEVLVAAANGPCPVPESDEWIGLFNRTPRVDLTGWTLDDAVDHSFPGYDPSRWAIWSSPSAASCSDVPVNRDRRRLRQMRSNSNNRIRLPPTKIRPTVHYYDGGYWSAWPMPGGSASNCVRDADGSGRNWAAGGRA